MGSVPLSDSYDSGSENGESNIWICKACDNTFNHTQNAFIYLENTIRV